MSLTHIDCHFYRGNAATNDTSSFVSINPRKRPGNLVLAASAAARGNIGGQVACKLGIEHFITGVLDYYDDLPAVRPDAFQDFFPAKEDKAGSEISLEVLEAAFKNANSSVYSFGHKLAAGGRMSASLIGVVLDDQIIAAGKVGVGSVYLYRRGELFPFFVESPESPVRDAFIGSNSLVAVELASVRAEESDTIIVLPYVIGAEKEAVLKELVPKVARRNQNPAELICRQLFGDIDRVPFAIVSEIGPETIYLAQAV